MGIVTYKGDNGSYLYSVDGVVYKTQNEAIYAMQEARFEKWYSCNLIRATYGDEPDGSDVLQWLKTHKETLLQVLETLRSTNLPTE